MSATEDSHAEPQPAPSPDYGDQSAGAVLLPYRPDEPPITHEMITRIQERLDEEEAREAAALATGRTRPAPADAE